MWDEPVSPKPQRGDGGLNTAIDAVAREMTAGSPADAAAFRRQVLARIELGAAPRRSWRAAFVLSPIAAAAAIAIGVAVFVSRDTAPRPAPPRGGGDVPLRANPPAAPLAAQAPATNVADAGLAEGRAAGTRAKAEARGQRPRAEAEEADSPIDPITIAPLTVYALTHDPNPIERLETPAPMTVAPLDITDPQKERDR